jgi:predicted PurR-regulated permease PerM
MERKFFFWLVLSGLVFGFVWLFRDVLTPFVLGAAIAYLLHPATTRLTRLKMPRWLASSLILLTFFVFVGALGTLILPLAIREAADLAQSLPAYIDQSIVFLTPYLSLIQNHLGEGYVDQAKALLSQNAGKIITLTGGVLGQIAQGGQAAFGALTTLILTPLVAFFMMNEWPRMTAWVDDLYPREDCGPLRDMMRRIDQKLSGFVRGQITVALILGTLYAVALMIAGLNYGFLIGVISGVLSIIPLVGSTVGLLMGVLVAWFQTGGDWVYVGTIALIFLGGQMIEGNILTPKLVGDSVGLHPLWVMFALMAGAALFGILGMLLAVPVAAIVGVLAGAGIAQYKSSTLYGRPPVSPDTP